MEILISSFCAGADDDIFVNFELRNGDNRCKERFLIPLSVYASLGLSAGESTQSVFESVERESRIYFAYKMALRASSYGVLSRKALARKLVMKGCEAEFARLAVERLVENGFHDEQALALREAEICARKLWGRGRIKQELAKKGFGEEEIRQAFYALEDNEIDFVFNCRALLERKYLPLPTEKKEMQKIIAALVRYGYSVSEIKEAISEMGRQN